MPRRSWVVATMLGAFVLLLVFAAGAQPGRASIRFTITLPDGCPVLGARIELSADGAGLTRTTSVEGPQLAILTDVRLAATTSR
jgi:hypothetical protein